MDNWTLRKSFKKRHSKQYGLKTMHNRQKNKLKEEKQNYSRLRILCLTLTNRSMPKLKQSLDKHQHKLTKIGQIIQILSLLPKWRMILCNFQSINFVLTSSLYIYIKYQKIHKNVFAKFQTEIKNFVIQINKLKKKCLQYQVNWKLQKMKKLIVAISLIFFILNAEKVTTCKQNELYAAGQCFIKVPNCAVQTGKDCSECQNNFKLTASGCVKDMEQSARMLISRGFTIVEGQELDSQIYIQVLMAISRDYPPFRFRASNIIGQYKILNPNTIIYQVEFDVNTVTGYEAWVQYKQRSQQTYVYAINFEGENILDDQFQQQQLRLGSGY